MSVIHVEDLVKSYPGASSPTISGLSFSVARGELLWVSGPSGSGKSTLLNVLGLLTDADSGSYRIDGVEMLHAKSAARTKARRSTVSTVFQRGNLFAHLNALDNILVGMPTPSRQDAATQLGAVGLADKATQLAGLLSGGEQERVAIARAAARCTPILLADEPVAGLDDRNADTVMDLLAESARQGVAVVVVSHDARTQRVASATLSLAGAAA
jgi:putative ABC transport system ATP-binding protein